MTKNVFSVPIFFIVFRETLEASIIVSVLFGLAKQIVYEDPSRLGSLATQTTLTDSNDNSSKEGSAISPSEDDELHRRRLLKRLRIQIFLGAAIGLLIALAIGGAFIAVWFTKASDLWAKSETLWEGIFELIASLMIFVMGITMLKMDRAKAKWRIKLQNAFDGKRMDNRTTTGKWILFVLPLITVLREGIEAVVFVGGVSLGQPATSIPLAAILGIFAGLLIGLFIYEFASHSTLSIFLIVMTNLIMLIGAGLFSKATGSFEQHAFNKLLGADVDDSGGTGPGSYKVQGNVWHLNCCSPENNSSGQGWSIFNAILGWTNNATLGSVLSYVFYWLAVIAVLVYMKFKEGRTKIAGRESATAVRRRVARENRALEQENDKKDKDGSTVQTLLR